MVEAFAQVLVQEGWSGSSTQRVADRAGVSVGTVYQYFENKEAILDALIERMMAAQLKVLMEVAARLSQTRPGLEFGVPVLIDGVLEAVRIRPELIRVLMLEAPADQKSAFLPRLKERFTQLVRGLLGQAGEEVRAGNVDIMANLLVSAVFAGVTDVITHRPELLHTDALRSELTLLVRRYVEP